MQQNWKFQRGDIFFTRFDNATGSEQSGNRPAVVLQNDVGNFYSPTLIVATMTSKAEKKVNQPTHCLLENAGLNMPSVVQAEQFFTIDKSRALKYLGHLTPEEMRRVDDAVRISLALNPIILTKTERLMMSNRPPDPKNARNKNVLVVGGSGSGKTRFWLKPNLLQCHSSYVVTDPKGYNYRG